MEQNSSGKLRVSKLTRKFSCNLREPLFNRLPEQTSSLVTVLNQTNLSLLFPSHLLMTHFNIIPSTPRFSKLSISAGFPTKSLQNSFFKPIRAKLPARFNFPDIISAIINVALSLLLSAQVPGRTLRQTEGEASPLRGAGSVQDTEHPSQDTHHHIHMVRRLWPSSCITHRRRQS
jgi:hypothetical protein